MTVEELIKELSKCNPKSEVYFGSWTLNVLTPIYSVFNHSKKVELEG